VYLLKRCPTKEVRDITPKEAWFKRKPQVSHFKYFGSIVCVDANEEEINVR
jgi:hypothetical protein